MFAKIKSSFIFITGFVLTACQTLIVPQEFERKDITTSTFTLTAWHKNIGQAQSVKIYIEGDGHSFNAHGFPTSDPTPHSYFLREIAFADKNNQVTYLARPCQFHKDKKCEAKYWSTARFSAEVIKAEADAVKKIAGDKPVILIGYSGGAQVAALIGVLYPEIKVKKIITIAGNLDHQTWTSRLNLLPLSQSLNLADYQEDFFKINQIHYIGAKDTIILPDITKNFVQNKAPVKQIDEATHHSGFEKIIPQILQER